MVQNDEIKTLQLEVETLKAALKDMSILEHEREQSRRVVLCMLEDLKVSRQSIERAKQEWVHAFDAVGDPIFIHDAEFRVVRANRAYADQAGMVINDIIGRPYYQCFPKNDGPLASCADSVKQDLKGVDVGEVKLDTGEIFLARAFPIHDEDGNYVHSIYIMQNVTEHSRAEQKLEASEKNYRSLFEDALDMIHLVDASGRITDANAAELATLGYTREEFIGKPLIDIVHPDLQELTKQRFKKVIGGKEIKNYETIFMARNGVEIDVEISAVPQIVDGRVMGARAFIRDIRERKLAETTLMESEEKFRQMTATAQDAILMMDKDGNISYFNSAAEKIFGYSSDEALGRELHSLITPERYRHDAAQGFEQFIQTGKGNVIGQTLELEALRKDGSEFPVELSISATWVKGQWNAVAFIRDISQRFEMEQKLLRENRARRVISSSNSALVHATDETTLLKDICHLITEEKVYPLAWVALCDKGSDQGCRLAAYAGVIDEDDLKMLGNSQGPAVTAIRNREIQLNTDAQNYVSCDASQQLAIKHNYHSILSYPLIQAGECFGALTITAYGTADFSPEEIDLLQELASDLAYGIIALRTNIARDRAEKQQRKTLKKLKTNLDTTVQAMAYAVEARDPYTAGHQRHVADLATAIATEMGLSDDEIDGVRIAATIHDLGKIYVPSEILSKPGRITTIEFELIKTHCQVGYDILKNIDFPWPVAEIILQHHERIDGSGYPQGLKGNEISLGAKIIAVADVTEAIASHRPYRPSLGIDFALETVEKERGVSFDAEVVDACLRLFREKLFEFSLD